MISHHQVCDMQLERPSGVYHAGETVNGHFILSLPERALIKAISLESNGYASTAWLKPQKQQKKQKKQKAKAKPPVAYGQRVDYFAKVDYFIGSEAALPQLMDAGAYRYDFSVQLPPHCPSSYEGAHGHIRYTLQVNVLRSGEQPTEPALLRQLQVIQRCGEPGVQQSGQLLAAGEVTALEQTPSLKFWQRPLQLQVDIPRTGYEPGMGISIHVRLHNAQQLPLQAIIYKLNQVTTYVGHQANKPKRVTTQVERRYLVSSSHKPSQMGSRLELVNFQHLHTLQVPQAPPTLSAATCACLQLGYEVEVTVQTNAADRFISAQIPIVIYQMPQLQSGFRPDLMSRSMGDLQNVGVASAPNQTPDPCAFANAAPNLCASMSSLVPASNFREAEFMVATNLNKKDKHTMTGEQYDFRPRYLYYEMEHMETEKVL